MALLFESDDVIRDQVEHSTFAGLTNEGLALATFLEARCTVQVTHVFVKVSEKKKKTLVLFVR